ncbi:hypothetical protein OROHE_022279 [Orobanche hederae]
MGFTGGIIVIFVAEFIMTCASALAALSEIVHLLFSFCSPAYSTQILKRERERKAQAQKEKVAGNAAYMKKDFEIAIEHYSKAIKLDDDDISFLTNRAAVYLEMAK